MRYVFLVHNKEMVNLLKLLQSNIRSRKIGYRVADVYVCFKWYT